MRRTPLRATVLTAGALALAAGPLAAPATAAPTEIQILTVNDFHGRLEADEFAGIPGAAVLAGAVDELSADVPTVFVAAGDNVGASPFVSAVAEDRPTIQALNQMGLTTSAVGNHEFDRGYDWLADPDTHGVDGAGLAEWETLAANVDGESPEMAPSTVADVGGVRVGFVGVVTEQTPSLVAAEGIQGLTFTDPVAAANNAADALVDGDLADVVVLLAHEGGSAADEEGDPASCATLGAGGGAFSQIIQGANANIDAIAGGHTHQEIDCRFPVLGDTEVLRPVVEAGQYGTNLGQITMTVDPDTDVISAFDVEVLPVTADEYPADQCVSDIVDAAAADAEELGSVVVGSTEAEITRATNDDGSENRGGESAISNLIADAQRAATADPGLGGAQIAFMNPGGVRADVNIGDITYGELATVQPFANGVITMTLTGEQIKEVLEQQFIQPGADAGEDVLALGVSDGFFFTFDPTLADNERILTITLEDETGTPVDIDPATEYRVTVNSFLADGGDNFTTLAEGTDRLDTGFNDLNVLIDYVEANTPFTAEVIEALTPRRDDVTTPEPGNAPDAAPDASEEGVTEEPAAEETVEEAEEEIEVTVDAGGAPRLAQAPVLASALPASCAAAAPPADDDDAGQNPGLSVDTGETGTSGPQVWALTGLALVLVLGGAFAVRRRGAVR